MCINQDFRYTGPPPRKPARPVLALVIICVTIMIIAVYVNIWLRYRIGQNEGDTVSKAGLFAAITMTVAAGCSPYVYKPEVSAFATGVGQLRQAYEAGVGNATTDRAAAQTLEWQDHRATLDLVGGCRSPTAQPCAVRSHGLPMEVAQTPEQEAAAASPVLDVLQHYVDALAAVTDAADRQAFDTAQAQLAAAVGGAAKAAGDASAGTEAGAVTSLVLTAGGVFLDTRRYRALCAGVLAARDAIPIVATTLGRQMVRLRDIRMRELNEAAMRLNAPLGPSSSPADYASRLGRLQGNVAVIETLRRSDPAKAAADMSVAHEALVAAVSDDTRQLAAVSEAISSFVKAATSVHDAFAAKPTGS